MSAEKVLRESELITLPTMRPNTSLRLLIWTQDYYEQLTCYQVLVQLHTQSPGSTGRASRDFQVFAELDRSRGWRNRSGSPYRRKVIEMRWPKTPPSGKKRMRRVTAADLAVWLDSERVTRKQKNLILPELRQAIEAEINKLPEA